MGAGPAPRRRRGGSGDEVPDRPHPARVAEVPEFIRRAREAWFDPRKPRPATIETPGPGQESVWDFPRPPRLEATELEIAIEFGGRCIARTRRALRLLETSHPPTYYLPPEDVELDCLRPAGGGSLCEWKGPARYWDVVVGERVARRAAWSYPDPFEEFQRVRDHLAFYCAPMDVCWVGGERAQPQPGGFYGGWISSHVVGPFKGGPGSAGW